jgi:hypothetical protein
MSNDLTKSSEVLVENTAEVSEEQISSEDKLVLDSIKVKRELALERAKTALAQNEAAELAQNNIMLQLAMKYNLKQDDQVNEKGYIIRKAAK